MYKTPLEVANPANLNLRVPFEFEIRWNFQPREKGKTKYQELKLKDHMKEQIRWMSVLSSDELYKLIFAPNDIAPAFHQVIEFFYQWKKNAIWTNPVLMDMSPSLSKTASLTDLIIGDGKYLQLWYYDNEEQYALPKQKPMNIQNMISRLKG